MSARKALYKVIFLNHGKTYELYARRVSASDLYGFVEVADLQFDAAGLVLDPVEERLRELMSRIDTSAARFARARDAVLNATALEAASRSAWTAAQAVWSVEASAMGMFNDALERRLGGVVAVINARETAVLALLDHEEAIGDAPREAGTKTGHARSATEDAPGFASGLPGGRDE